MLVDRGWLADGTSGIFKNTAFDPETNNTINQVSIETTRRVKFILSKRGLELHDELDE